jgi:CubicO group peptidase (beta-lactamase class C family)
MNRELLQAAFDAVEEGVGTGALPSGVLAVATGERTVRGDAFGPVGKDDVFLLASISKPIFCTAVMRLVERGKLRLNQPVATVIPEFAARGKEDVRLWHLLTHTSGLDEGTFGPLWGRGDRAALTAAALGAGLTFRPGSRYSYCNVSYAVMAELIRRVTGRDDRELLRADVLEPLGMRSTGYDPPADAAPVHAAPWGDAPGGREYWTGLAIPAGGLWSTAADLIRFGQAFLKPGKVLAPATARTMTSLQTEGLSEMRALGDGPAYYGLGWGKSGPRGGGGPSTELRTPAGFGHGGATGTSLWIEPELDLVFVFLTNRWGLDAPHANRALNAAIAAAST